MLETETAEHAFLGGRLILREPKRGHRSGTDAVLLAAATSLQPGQHLVEVGAGAGAAALAVLCRLPGTTATLIERDAEMAALCRHNIVANGFEDRAEVVEADVGAKGLALQLRDRLGDVVISNPPFYLAGTVRPSVTDQKARSHVLDGMGHGDWVDHMLRLARPRACAALIHRPEALPPILAAVGSRASVTLRPVHARQCEPATRLLISLALGRRSPLAIQSGLVLHDPSDNRFTPLADALHRGTAQL